MITAILYTPCVSVGNLISFLNDNMTISAWPLAETRTPTMSAPSLCCLWLGAHSYRVQLESGQSALIGHIGFLRVSSPRQKKSRWLLPHISPHKQLFFYPRGRNTLYLDIKQSVITLVTIFLHDATWLFLSAQKDDCIFLYSSQTQAAAEIKQMAELPPDLIFAAFLLHVRPVAFKKLWDRPTGHPILIYPFTYHKGNWRLKMRSIRLWRRARGLKPGRKTENARSPKPVRPGSSAALGPSPLCLLNGFH